MDEAWLGYKDDRLCAIELEGFHAGETVAEWESRGYRVEVVTNGEAVARWRAAFAAAARDGVSLPAGEVH